MENLLEEKANKSGSVGSVADLLISVRSSVRDYNLQFSNYIVVTNPSNTLLLLLLGVSVLAVLLGLMDG